MNEVEVIIPSSVYLPCYRHLNHSTADINFLWGGRDSGKSHYIAQRLIRKCLKAKHFRCLMVKKTGNSIQESQWQTIKDIVEEWHLSSLFVFKKSPLSIECVNGNKFLARGCDDAANIKSIKDPTDVWYEEMNQLELTDFITIASTLRSNKVAIEQWGSFNPEAVGDFEEFWIYKTFFAGKEDIYHNFTSTWTIDLPAGETYDFTYTSTHTTWLHNPHVKPARKAFLLQLATIDPYYYKVFTLGHWGNVQVGDRFCFTFDREKHCAPTVLNRQQEVRLSFDFNVNPITCQVFQFYDNTLYGLESIKLDQSDIHKLCDHILAAYPGCLFQITGDATGRNTSALVQDGINYYTVIKTKLNLSIGQLAKVPTVNPKVKENRVLTNASFTLMKTVLDPVKCKGLVFDLENVSVDDMGEIDKGDRANPKKRADHLDGYRYLITAFHKNILKM